MSVPMRTGSWLRLECGHKPEQAAVADGDVVDCPGCDRRRLPPGLRAARDTPIFTSATTPAGLRRAHRTAVWAELVVTAGEVDLEDEDFRQSSSTRISSGSRITLVPGRAHSVTPSPDGRFYVRFYEPILASPLPQPQAAPADRSGA